MKVFAELWADALYGRIPFHLEHTHLSYPNEMWSDIQMHLPVLQWFSSQCETVTEFGVRNVVSTLALLAGARKKVVSYDIKRTQQVDDLLAMETPVPWSFHERSTIDEDLVLEPTEMLFIDTEHRFEHVRAEITQHWDSVSRFLAFHDTSACKQDRYLEGIEAGLEGRSWKTVYWTELNNGLWVIEKAPQ